MTEPTPNSWEDDIFDALKKAGVSQIPYVPDAGHSHLIRRVHSDPDMTPIVLTTEEEGIAIMRGLAWREKVCSFDAIKWSWQLRKYVEPCDKL